MFFLQLEFVGSTKYSRCLEIGFIFTSTAERGVNMDVL